VTLAQDLGRGNLAARQSRVQLQEVHCSRVPQQLRAAGCIYSGWKRSVSHACCHGLPLGHGRRRLATAALAAAILRRLSRVLVVQPDIMFAAGISQPGGITGCTVEQSQKGLNWIMRVQKV
jgi:hypothetical protein